MGQRTVIVKGERYAEIIALPDWKQFTLGLYKENGYALMSETLHRSFQHCEDLATKFVNGSEPAELFKR